MLKNAFEAETKINHFHRPSRQIVEAKAYCEHIPHSVNESNIALIVVVIPWNEWSVLIKTRVVISNIYKQFYRFLSVYRIIVIYRIIGASCVMDRSFFDLDSETDRKKPKL